MSKLFLCTFKVKGEVTYCVEAEDECHAQQVANAIKMRHRGRYHPQITMGDQLSDAVNPYYEGNPEHHRLSVDVEINYDPDIEEYNV